MDFVYIFMYVMFGAAFLIFIVSIVLILRKKKGWCRMPEFHMPQKKDPTKWTIVPRCITFGGKEASIGIALKETIVVRNNSDTRNFTVCLNRDVTQEENKRYKIIIKPEKFQLEKGYEQPVDIYIRMFYSIEANETILFKSSPVDAPDEEEVITVPLEAHGKQSTRIDPYDVAVGDAIGEGSFGIVYRGLYKNQYNVAIKRLKVIEEQTIEDFNKEADILERIDSKYTVKFFGAIVTDEHYCFVTEFVPYGALSSAIPKIIPLDTNGAKRILCGLNIAKALKYLHENKILHRDLKPENVLVVNNSVGFSSSSVICKLTDFGTSKILQSKDGNMTKVVGTPLYMAPEVINTNNYGKESDIYSFGASFIELWTGKAPFSELNLQFYTFVGKIASGELTLTFAPGPSDTPCPPEVVNIINRCVNRDPGSRPQIDEIIATLDGAWTSLRTGITDPDLFH